MADELPLSGGLINTVVRVGATVRRTPPAEASFVRALLHHFQRMDWTGAPRHLGEDTRGREMLTFIDGLTVAERPDLVVDSDPALAATARMVREFHDLTAGTALAGDAEVVCHNDLDPRNTVYRETRDGVLPVAFLDWDIAAPGRRIHDVARICWQYLRLGPQVTEIAAAARRIRLICDSYGLEDRGGLMGVIIWWQERCWRGMLEGAAAGLPAMVRMRDGGIAEQVREAAEWTEDNAGALAAVLTDPLPESADRWSGPG